MNDNQRAVSGSALAACGSERLVTGVVGDCPPGLRGCGFELLELVAGEAVADGFGARVVEAGPAGARAHAADYSGHGKWLTDRFYAATVSRVEEQR